MSSAPTPDEDVRITAQRRFSAAYTRFVQSWSVVQTLTQLADSSFEAVSQTARTQARDALVWSITNPKYRIFKRDSPWTQEQFGSLAESMGEATLGSYSGAIKAASLVFLQAALDSLALDLCEVTMTVDPASWDSAINEKTVRLEDVRCAGYAELRAKALHKFLKGLDRASLPRKLELLFERCQPVQAWPDDYCFDLERIKRIDSLRHKIVHEDGLLAASKLNQDDIAYLQETALNLISLVCARQGLELKFAEPSAPSPST